MKNAVTRGNLSSKGLEIRGELLARTVKGMGREKVEAAMGNDEVRSLVNWLCENKAQAAS